MDQWPEFKASDVCSGNVQPDPDAEFDTRRLGGILSLCHALTAKATHGGVDFYYRNVASAGALYPFELYVALSGVRGLADGVYHHGVANQALTLLRREDPTDRVILGLGLGPDDEPYPVVSFFLTAIFYRSSWKYRDRGFRYHLLDTGHLLENLAQALKVFQTPFRLYYDFDDAVVNDVLRVDVNREVCLAVATAMGKSCGEKFSTELLRAPVQPESASQTASKEADYPLILETYRASGKVVRLDMEPASLIHNLDVATSRRIEVAPPGSSPEAEGYISAVFKRRSSRNFVPNELPSDHFKALLHMMCYEAGSGDHPMDQTLAVGLLVGRVEGVKAGFYLLDTEDLSLIPVTPGFMMDSMATACLNQAWLANCALHFLFISNLPLIEKQWGPRAYRYAMLSAGRLGQRIYVGATAMLLGACGIGAYYDDDARRLLGLPEQWSLLYLVAAGPVKKLSRHA
jgi:SagB-type dehydrogenase family enzyme